jgi:penicillin-binding protein 2
MSAISRNDFERKIKVLSAIVIGIFFLILLRIYYLQMIQGSTILLKSRANQTRVIRINAPRGIFFDRNGKIMVSTRISHNVMVIPDDVNDKPEVIKRLSKLLKYTETDLRSKLKPDPRKPGRYPYQYITVKQDIDSNTLVKLYEEKMDLPGVEIDEFPLRYYKNGEFASHLFGYIREINDRELAELKDSGYRQGDIIGKSGLERTYEQYLRGEEGGVIYEVDIHDRPLRRLETREPQPGNNLHLTIDYKVQFAAEKALEEQLQITQANTKYKNAKSGLAIALDPRTGDVLAMVSKPGYDSNIFVGPIPKEVAQRLYNNPFHPFSNRVVRGEYAPGSTFKPITVLAAFMEGKVTLDDRFYCNGYDRFPGFPKCWTVTNPTRVPMHGSQNVVDGIKNSCNIVMSELGRRIGPFNLAKYARSFGLGKPTGINLYPGEKKGLVPDPDWKRKYFKKDKTWYPSETGMYAIGQGALTVTPIQLAQVYAAIANDGKVYRPRLVSKITNSNGERIAEFRPEVIANIHIVPEANAIVKLGMEKVIAPGGTASGQFRDFPLDKYPVAGKTGTAQKPPYDSNGLFACFAPVNKPEIVVVVVVEQGGGGGSAAAPVARKILEAYFNIQRSPKPADGHQTPSPSTAPNAGQPILGPGENNMNENDDSQPDIYPSLVD